MFLSLIHLKNDKDNGTFPFIIIPKSEKISSMPAGNWELTGSYMIGS